MGNPAFDPSPQCINLVGVAYLCSTKEVKASRLQQGHPQIRREVNEFKGSLGWVKLWKEGGEDRRAKHDDTYPYSQHTELRKLR